jgi:hypothetical protein
MGSVEPFCDRRSGVFQVMNTQVASWTNAADDRARPISAPLDPLAESFRMLGLAVVGSATVICLMWLVS